MSTSQANDSDPTHSWNTMLEEARAITRELATATDKGRQLEAIESGEVHDIVRDAAATPAPETRHTLKA